MTTLTFETRTTRPCSSASSSGWRDNKRLPEQQPQNPHVQTKRTLNINQNNQLKQQSTATAME
jgi:hypothetical protein